MGKCEESASVVAPHSCPDVPPAIDKELAERYRGACVLIAEDDPFNQEVLQELVTACGLVVDMANDGAEAVEKVARGRYDLILMDIQMPKMDGLEAAQCIRRLPSGEKIPIIAVTAHAYAEAEEFCAKVGMNGFLSKPVDPDALYRTMLEWLNRQKAT